MTATIFVDWEILLANPVNTGWALYYLVARATNQLVGVAGFAGAPGADGVVALGYSILPHPIGDAGSRLRPSRPWWSMRSAIRRFGAWLPRPFPAYCPRLACS
jgi:hypothetical protein